MAIGITTGPGGDWANIWKPLIDAFGPVRGDNHGMADEPV
jgi:hypothetical protein